MEESSQTSHDGLLHEGTMIIFRSFSRQVDMIDGINTYVNSWIGSQEQEGFSVNHKTVHVAPSHASGVPWIVITVWMEKESSDNPTEP